ncbi:MAG: hypothetical protein V3U49_05335 [Nitrososphaerales archaeon]
MSVPNAVTYQNFNSFTAKIPQLNVYSNLEREIRLYHESVKYRMDIAHYSLIQMLEDHSFGIPFNSGLTGFLVQAKAALDCLAETINLRYGLSLRPGEFTTDIKRLANNTVLLSSVNRPLAEVIEREFGQSSHWFKNFKYLRDSEGVHRKRTSRQINLEIGVTYPQDRTVTLEGQSEPTAQYCTNILDTINRVIEECYSLMIEPST